MKKIFVSHSRRDAPWVKRLYDHLRPLMATGKFETWLDSDISPGEDWRAAIDRSIESASAVILMISPDYLASDFITNAELPRLLESAKTRRIPIYPILVRSSVLTKALHELNFVNAGRAPLEQLSRAEQEFVLASTAFQVGKQLGRPDVLAETAASGDPHNVAINVAISNTGVTGINFVGADNIFVDAERKLREKEDHGDE